MITYSHKNNTILLNIIVELKDKIARLYLKQLRMVWVKKI